MVTKKAAGRKKRKPLWTHEFVAPSPDTKRAWYTCIDDHRAKGEQVIVDEQAPVLVDGRACTRYRYNLQVMLRPLGLGTK